MNKKLQQKSAASNAFNRNQKDDWEIIAVEQYDENKKLTEKLVALEVEIGKNKDIIHVSPNKCKNWKYSDRNDFEMGDIEELAEDIKNNGQLQPAIIRMIKDDLDCDYEIIAGERRWRACKLANVTLAAIVTEQDDAGCLIIQTSENKKKSLSPYSLAIVYERLMTDLGVSQNDLSRRLGIPKSSFGDLMSFNKVPADVWKIVGDISNVKARTAAFIAATCNRGDDYLDAVIKLASNIRDGIGADNLSKLIDKHLSNTKTKRNSSQVYESKSGGVLFRITSEGRISLSKVVMKKIDMEGLAMHIERYIEGTSAARTEDL